MLATNDNDSSRRRERKARAPYDRYLADYLQPGFTVLLVFLCVCLATSLGARTQAAAAERMNVTKEIILSPGHSVAPRSMTRTANGDIIVVGSTGIGDPWPWATRVSNSGAILWEFVPGGLKNPFTDISMRGQLFFSAAELDDGNILLCGMKKISRQTDERAVTLTRLTRDGAFLDERILSPKEPSVQPGEPGDVVCGRWGDGVAVLGVVSGVPAGTGWLTRLDVKGDVLWQKYGGYYANGEFAETSDGGLLVCWPRGGWSVARLDAKGDLVSVRKSEAEEQHLVFPYKPGTTARIINTLAPLCAEIVNLDSRMSSPHRLGVVSVAVKKALELENGATVIAGGERHLGLTASLTTMSPDHSVSSLLAEPPYATPWFTDAVRGNPHELVAVRTVGGGTARLSWILLSP
jgi:hypothetical protein